MIGFRVKIVDKSKEAERAIARALAHPLNRLAYDIRLAAIRLFKTRKGSSPAGQPPHTRKGRRLPKAILYAVDKDKLSAIVGPVHSRVGIVGEAHEFGTTYMGAKYPERAFMGPALAENIDRMPSYWLHSVGN